LINNFFNQNKFFIFVAAIKLKQKKSIMENLNLTIREIRRILFDSNKYSVIGAEEMTNKESRDFLYSKQNQEEILNVIDNNSHLLIWA